MNAELERLRPLPERLTNAIAFLDALRLNRRFQGAENEGLSLVHWLLRDLLAETQKEIADV